jgi:hypothetical protein
MQDNTNKVDQQNNNVASTAAARPKTLRDIYDLLGPRNPVVSQVISNLAAREVPITVARSSVYNVIYGRSSNAVITEEFLKLATAELNRRADVQARIAAITA